MGLAGSEPVALDGRGLVCERAWRAWAAWRRSAGAARGAGAGRRRGCGAAGPPGTWRTRSRPFGGAVSDRASCHPSGPRSARPRSCPAPPHPVECPEECPEECPVECPEECPEECPVECPVECPEECPEGYLPSSLPDSSGWQSGVRPARPANQCRRRP